MANKKNLKRKRGIVITYDQVPEEVYKFLLAKQGEMKAEKGAATLSISSVITKFLRTHEAFKDYLQIRQQKQA